MWFNTKQKAGILLNYNEQKQKQKTKTSQQEVCEEASNEKEI